MATVALREVSKVFGDGTVAVDNISLDVDDGEFMVLLGPSGCGKSTVLRMIAGLEDPTSGSVMLDGALANDLAPRERKVAMVFQDFGLYPHMSVNENIGFPLRIAGLEPEPRQERVADIAAALGISPRTAEGHRRQVLRKMEVGSTAELATAWFTQQPTAPATPYTIPSGAACALVALRKILS